MPDLHPRSSSEEDEPYTLISRSIPHPTASPATSAFRQHAAQISESYLVRPWPLMILAVLDLVVNGIFTDHFRLEADQTDDPNPSTNIFITSSPSPLNPHHTTLLRLLTLGYARSIVLIILSLRKNWAAKGRLYVLVGFVVTMLAVLWEVNVSVLYKGFEGRGGSDGVLGMGRGGREVLGLELGVKKGSKAKMVYLFLQAAFASLEYIAFIISLSLTSYTPLSPHHSTPHPRLTIKQASNRQRATSLRFEEEDVFLASPVRGKSRMGAAAGPGLGMRREELEVQAEEEGDRPRPSRLFLPGRREEEFGYGGEGEEGEEEEEEEDFEGDDAFEEEDDEESSGDEDEIIDLPLPPEARRERRTSAVSLRSRQRSGNSRSNSIHGLNGHLQPSNGHGTATPSHSARGRFVEDFGSDNGSVHHPHHNNRTHPTHPDFDDPLSSPRSITSFREIGIREPGASIGGSSGGSTPGLGMAGMGMAMERVGAVRSGVMRRLRRMFGERERERERVGRLGGSGEVRGRGYGAIS